jgi:uncharacterized protein YndB with AHSA1/START domain
MLKTLIAIAALVAVLGGGVVAYAAARPDTFRIQRSALINAPPEKVFGIINDFQQWPSWSPWQKLDPSMKTTVSGPATGKGAVSTWDGNSKVGAGRTEITETVAPSKITMKLDMARPFEAHNIVEYTLEPKGAATSVTWAMHGAQPLLGKVMSVFIDCEKMVGKDFEEGLANLRALSER